jgi:hypothetical protein
MWWMILIPKSVTSPNLMQFGAIDGKKEEFIGAGMPFSCHFL